IAILLLCGNITVAASSDTELDAAVKDTAEYIYRTVKDPQVGSIGGEWAVLGLARSSYTVPENYYQKYYTTVEEYVKACDGVLHQKKYTEYSRLIVALTSIGKDPGNVAGYDLLKPLGDYDKTVWQGLNGPIWALIALDSGNYPMPENAGAKTQATRDMYIDRILECQLSDGGFSLFGGTAAASAGDNTADPDITGMALQALAKYRNREDVRKATEEALQCMSEKQNGNGGFSSWNTTNSESVVQIIVALTELGIPLDDPRFVKNGNTLLDNLMTFYLPGKGFLHTANGSGSNQMAAEQGFYGLVAAQRAGGGRNSLYQMSDAIKIANAEENSNKTESGLPGKLPAVAAVPICSPGSTFTDIAAHKNRTAIEALAVRGIINGKTDLRFAPDDTMSRAEFAAIIVRSLGLAPEVKNEFKDIPEDSWYASYVATAYSYGIVNGISENVFNPKGTITREEAAAMVSRAAKLCGMDTEFDTASTRDVLAQFADYVQSSSWARSSLAFCYSADILSQEDIEIMPKAAVKRCEIAEMLFRMLGAAKLL
ncbi:MAG TPA: S-layer homology domain-containing protein, partial [Negativicutes bacterium]|nr:S-layer homology domain-containing protein [Negativicutes bacterium]